LVVVILLLRACVGVGVETVVEVVVEAPLLETGVLGRSCGGSISPPAPKKFSEEIEADKNKDATVTTAFHMYQNQITLLILMQPRIAKTLGSLLFKEVFSFTFFKAISTMSV
jgi:hypothetical protein